MEDRIRDCELCSGSPDLYCSSDDAYLCFHCDSIVHGTNFLVARHLRLFICRNCNSLTGNSFSGPRSRSESAACCSSCSSSDHETDSISSCSSSSTCISTTTQSLCSGSSNHRTRQVGTLNYAAGGGAETTDLQRSGKYSPISGKIGAVFSNWCQKLGLKGDLVEPKAVEAMELLCTSGQQLLPFRVSLAASFWLGARLSGEKQAATPRKLLRLALVSGVPAVLIVRVEARLEREVRSRGRSRRGSAEMEEGWGESDV